MWRETFSYTEIHVKMRKPLKKDKFFCCCWKMCSWYETTNRTLSLKVIHCLKFVWLCYLKTKSIFLLIIIIIINLCSTFFLRFNVIQCCTCFFCDIIVVFLVAYLYLFGSALADPKFEVNVFLSIFLNFYTYLDKHWNNTSNEKILSNVIIGETISF